MLETFRLVKAPVVLLSARRYQSYRLGALQNGFTKVLIKRMQY